ncbi:DUF6144 family protein [Clostridiaceae bacterium M8S5]|nr:DUF6144 family protein [Clostridiaceae bacterium M8S5]
MDFKKFWFHNLCVSIEKEDAKSCKEVVKESNFENEENISRLINVLDKRLDNKAISKALEHCGRMCLDPKLGEQAKTLMNELKDIDLVLEALNKQSIGGGNMYKENDVIYASYTQCYCPNVKHSNKLSATYCNCSVGWFKEFFETFLNSEIKVELKKSIIKGDSECKFIIKCK